MKIRPGIELANLTDVGCERAQNEDNFCYAEPESDEELQKRGRLIVIADGMGGQEGGQMASTLAVDTVREVFLNGPAEDPAAALVAAYQSAHAAIQDYARAHPELSGMGTTCTAAVLRDGYVTYGHVGDSRLYLLRAGEIVQLTRDQSYVQQMVDNGVINAEQAKTHPSRNILTSALGSDSAVEADFAEAPIPLLTNDALLLCTDGLHGGVSDEEMLAACSGNPPREACRKLVELAKERGGPDNITIQIVRIDETPAAAKKDSTAVGG
ncbi:MAG: Stp1/IreP family PP2C-type Ser/Thr phosphatase [Candidatus Acidiferrales bacterium]